MSPCTCGSINYSYPEFDIDIHYCKRSFDNVRSSTHFKAIIRQKNISPSEVLTNLFDKLFLCSFLSDLSLKNFSAPDFKRSFDDICSCCHSHLLIPVANNSNTIRLQAPKSELEEKNLSICWLDYSKVLKKN